MVNGAQEILRVLEEAGVDCIIGIPGSSTVLIFSETAGRPFQVVLARQEHYAAVMADAYARASGRPAVLLGQGAFVCTNGAFGVTEAFASSSPMIVIADLTDFGSGARPGSQSVTGEYGSPDIPALMRAITKFTAVATEPNEGVVATQLAVKHALAGSPGPCAVLLHTRAIMGATDPAAYPHPASGNGYLVTSRPVASPADVDRALEVIRGAARPVIVAGKGVHNAGAHAKLRRFAETWEIPVVTSYTGKSAIEETHPLSLGMIGNIGRRSANEWLAAADAVLVIGCKLASSETLSESRDLIDPARQRIVQVDIEPRNCGWTFPVEVGLVGDARAVLEQLLAAGQPPDGQRSRLADLQQRKAADPAEADPGSHTDSAPVLPQRFVTVLQETIDPASNLTLDAGYNRMWLSHFYRAQRPYSVFAPGGIVGMGWALPAALGVKLARPAEPVVAVMGDGGFMMSVQAIATAVEAGLPFVGIVLNDSGLGMVRHHQQQWDKVVASRFSLTDCAAIARGFGIQGIRVEDSTELGDTIKHAQASNEPVILDVVIDDAVIPDRYFARTRRDSET